ncbi:hypothetical protein R3P38DRAFT_3198692 [Favolaschia claudopus]|uniref:Uncharacterized protein n=1 Tax=Favolaschia claudopus TaxID=2862362 RepID=A0AAW0B460_9AGAR
MSAHLYTLPPGLQRRPADQSGRASVGVESAMHIQPIESHGRRGDENMPEVENIHYGFRQDGTVSNLLLPAQIAQKRDTRSDRISGIGVYVRTPLTWSLRPSLTPCPHPIPLSLLPLCISLQLHCIPGCFSSKLPARFFGREFGRRQANPHPPSLNQRVSTRMHPTTLNLVADGSAAQRRDGLALNPERTGTGTSGFSRRVSLDLQELSCSSTTHDIDYIEIRPASGASSPPNLDRRVSPDPHKPGRSLATRRGAAPHSFDYIEILPASGGSDTFVSGNLPPAGEPRVFKLKPTYLARLK